MGEVAFDDGLVVIGDVVAISKWEELCFLGGWSAPELVVTDTEGVAFGRIGTMVGVDFGEQFPKEVDIARNINR